MDRGLMPLGPILIGAVAEWAGVVMGGGCVAVTLAVFAARRQIWTL